MFPFDVTLNDSSEWIDVNIGVLSLIDAFLRSAMLSMVLPSISNNSIPVSSNFTSSRCLYYDMFEDFVNLVDNECRIVVVVSR